MKYGVCGDPAMAIAAKQASFDYFEWSVGGLLKPMEPPEAFRAELERLKTAEFPCPVLNCFVPGQLKITGPDADISALKNYVTTVFERAEQAGVKVIVFGSGDARRIPDGFSREDAHAQLVRFCSMCAPIAGRHGVTVVIEPLNTKECNVLNTVGECAALVREVAQPAVRLLVDSFHFHRDNDSYDDIIANADLFSHVHLATTVNRLIPAAEPCDFAPFFRALAKAGYDGRISIEAKITDPAKELAKALSLLRELSGDGSKRHPDARS